LVRWHHRVPEVTANRLADAGDADGEDVVGDEDVAAIDSNSSTNALNCGIMVSQSPR